MNPPPVGISIITSSRWGDVDRTLSMIAKWPEFEDSHVIVLDDGSAEPVPAGLAKRFPGVWFIESRRSLGVPEQRTRIARLLDTEFVLQLDENSYPVEGSVSEAVSFLRGRADIVALALNVVQGAMAQPSFDTDAPPHQVEMFIGCGVLLRRERFLELGGYIGALGCDSEERHFCARAIREGQAIYKFPSLVIRHEQPSSARSLAKIAFYKGRNRVLLVLWNYPIAAVPFRLATSLPGTLALVRPRDYPAAIAGFFAGLYDGIRMLGQRRPLSLKQYHWWRHLPSF